MKWIESPGFSDFDIWHYVDDDNKRYPCGCVTSDHTTGKILWLIDHSGISHRGPAQSVSHAKQLVAQSVKP